LTEVVCSEIPYDTLKIPRFKSNKKRVVKALVEKAVSEAEVTNVVAGLEEQPRG
jgi:hypothetical protein